MATKKKTDEVIEEVTEVTETPETVEPKKEDKFERVPYTLEVDWENPKANAFQFVSVGDYAANIKRGEQVMIPRYVAKFLDQQQADERAAKMRMLNLQDEFRESSSRA